jgi:hypothetical protein
MRFALLLVSRIQGVGKTTLAQDVLAPLVGRHNVSFPSEHMISDSRFTSWIAHKRLAVVHEIYSGHSRKTYDRLKDKITDASVDVDEKFIKPYTIENYLHIVASSNSMQALYLDDADRRWLVPRVTEALRDKKYWDDMHEWLRGDGLGIILHHLNQLAENPAMIVGTGEHAPMTDAKGEVIAESRSVGEQIAFHLGEIAKEKPNKVVFAVEDVRLFVADQRRLVIDDPRLERPLALRHMLLRAGMQEPAVAPDGRRRRYKVNLGSEGGKDHRLTYVVANFEIAPNTPWEKLEPHLERARDLWAM